MRIPSLACDLLLPPVGEHPKGRQEQVPERICLKGRGFAEMHLSDHSDVGGEGAHHDPCHVEDRHEVPWEARAAQQHSYAKVETTLLHHRGSP